MRWLKHMTCANRDEKMMRIMDEFGAAGYGMYWLILETIAEKLDENNDTFVEMSAQSWRKLTGIPPKTLEKFLSFCQVLGVFTVENSENLIRVDCPNLLKYRDEYQRKQSKKSGQAPDKLQPKNIETETEEEIEEEKEKEGVNKVTNEKSTAPAERTSAPPSLEDVREENAMKGYNATDEVIQEFFYHYEAVGWKTSGGASIQNWRALLQKWLIKDGKMEKQRGKRNSETPSFDVSGFATGR